MLVACLLNGTLTQKGQFVPTATRETTQSAKDGQRGTMHITLHYFINDKGVTINVICNLVTPLVDILLNIIVCIQFYVFNFCQ